MAADRFTRAVREIGRRSKTHRHDPMAAQQAALRRKLQGHAAYYGITVNGRALARFHTARSDLATTTTTSCIPANIVVPYPRRRRHPGASPPVAWVFPTLAYSFPPSL